MSFVADFISRLEEGFPGCAQKNYSPEQIESINRVAGKRTAGELDRAAAALIDRWEDRFSLPTPAAIAEKLQQAVQALAQPSGPVKPEWKRRQEEQDLRRALVDAAMREFSAGPDAARAIAEGWWEGRCGLKRWAESMASALAQAATTPKGFRYSLPTQALVPDFYLQDFETKHQRRGELSRLVHEAHRTGRVNITLPDWARDALIYMHTMRAAAYGTTTTAPRPQHPAQAVKQQMEGVGSE